MWSIVRCQAWLLSMWDSCVMYKSNFRNFWENFCSESNMTLDDNVALLDVPNVIEWIGNWGRNAIKRTHYKISSSHTHTHTLSDYEFSDVVALIKAQNRNNKSVCQVHISTTSINQTLLTSPNGGLFLFFFLFLIYKMFRFWKCDSNWFISSRIETNAHINLSRIQICWLAFCCVFLVFIDLFELTSIHIQRLALLTIQSLLNQWAHSLPQRKNKTTKQNYHLT